MQVFTEPRFGQSIGFCIKGQRAGPNILIAARSKHAMRVFEAISKEPAARPTRGALYLIDVKTLDAIGFTESFSALMDEDETIAAQHCHFIPSEFDLSSTHGAKYLERLLQSVASWLTSARC